MPCEDMPKEDGQSVAFLHFVSSAAQCQPWPFRNSVGYFYEFQVLPPQKRLASTFQPTMKLVIEPASAILLHSLMPALAFQRAILE